MKRLLSTTIAMLLFFSLHAFGAGEPPQLRLVASKTAVYVGEEFELTIELRHAGGLRAPVDLRWPALDGFVAQRVEGFAPRRERGPSGEVFVESLRRTVRPLSTGRSPLVAEVAIGTGTFRSPPLGIRVLPLPSANIPEGFDGAVGKGVSLALSSEGEGTREVVVTLLGDAPFDIFPSPRIFPGKDERIVSIGKHFSGEGANRQGAWRYLYSPGDGRVGHLAVATSLFDPDAREYRRLDASLEEESFAYGRWVVVTLFCLVFLLFFLWFGFLRKKPSLDEAVTILLGRSPAGLSRDRIMNILHGKGVPNATIQGLKSYYKEWDRARFAPLDPLGKREDRDVSTLVRFLRNSIDK